MTKTGRRVRFIANFAFKPTSQTTIAYRAGQVEFVKLACAERAIRMGKAEAIEFDAPPAGIAATIAKAPRERKPRNA